MIGKFCIHFMYWPIPLPNKIVSFCLKFPVLDFSFIDMPLWNFFLLKPNYCYGRTHCARSKRITLKSESRGSIRAVALPGRFETEDCSCRLQLQLHLLVPIPEGQRPNLTLRADHQQPYINCFLLYCYNPQSFTSGLKFKTWNIG